MKYYTEDHEWVEIVGDEATVGISEYAADELGDITYVELPEEEDDFIIGDRLGEVESVNSSSDIYSPISGTVSQVNEALTDEPGLINESPEEKGWLCRLINFDSSELDDMILIKSDGYPTYNFANVVDDHLMGITHVIRGSEYLSSTPKYNLLYQAFGWEVPTYIHCPPVMKDAQHKLSKRNGDASYQDLVAKGYLPAAVLNYLLLLGWAPEGEQEIFSLDEMIKIWDPARISKSPAIFDPLKLRAINAAYIRALPAEEFRKLADPFIDQAVHVQIDRDLLCANLQPRCEVLEDIPPQLDFFDAVLPIDAEMYRNKKQKTTPESAKEALSALLPVLEAQTDWSRDAIFEACKQKAEAMEKKNGWLLFPLGIALSGKARTPGGGTDLAAMMGKEETLRRLNAAIEAL